MAGSFSTIFRTCQPDRVSIGSETAPVGSEKATASRAAASSPFPTVPMSPPLERVGPSEKRTTTSSNFAPPFASGGGLPGLLLGSGTGVDQDLGEPHLLGDRPGLLLAFVGEAEGVVGEVHLAVHLAPDDALDGRRPLQLVAELLGRQSRGLQRHDEVFFGRDLVLLLEALDLLLDLGVGRDDVQLPRAVLEEGFVQQLAQGRLPDLFPPGERRGREGLPGGRSRSSRRAGSA